MLSDVGSIINQIMQGSFRSILCDPKYNERAQGNETFEVSVLYVVVRQGTVDII